MGVVTRELIDRREEQGQVVELYRRDAAFELVFPSSGRTVASDVRGSEKQLAELALAPMRDRDDITVLLAGLGMGFLLRHLLDYRGVKRVDVVERSPAIIQWEAQHFGVLNGEATRDPRVRVHQADLATFMREHSLGTRDVLKEGWLAIVLDIDEGPSLATDPDNAKLYSEAGIARFEPLLRGGAVLAVWSKTRETDFLKRINGPLQNVAEIVVPTDAGNLDYVYRGRRPATPLVTDPNRSAN